MRCALRTQLRHIPGTRVYNRQHARVPSYQRCRPHAGRARHTHVRSVAVAGCVCRSIPLSASLFFSSMYLGWCIPVHILCCCTELRPPPRQQWRQCTEVAFISSFLHYQNPAAQQQQQWAHLARIVDRTAHNAVCDPTSPLLQRCSAPKDPFSQTAKPTRSSTRVTVQQKQIVRPRIAQSSGNLW